MADNKQPIIIKKITKKGGGHHGGAWKVAYADFVTAMMALFIVLWILGQDQEVKDAVSGYFRDPVGYSLKSRAMIDNANISPQITSMNQRDLDQINKEEEERRFEEMKDDLTSELSEDANFIPLLDQMTIEMTTDGMRIEMLESENDVFFELGSSELSPKAKKFLEIVGAKLAEFPNKIAIEGHTDARPLNSSGSYTNFELSTDRANSARRTLVNGGVPAKQIDEIIGFADKRLKDKNDPNSVVNRRISIILKYIDR
ncbi:MAG: OmpA family protein [Bacteroidetes bacterium]|nr:OmpA family protein [Bacteroidota bacterium]MBU1115134.1 OmpA family protein [Bacteroidota bacterium]MBU1799273.1 OmpA family protein [Bacteroidota bacterium]